MTAAVGSRTVAIGMRLGNIIDRVSMIAGQISGLLMIVTALIIMFEVIMRGIFNIPTKWEYEVTIYLMMWFVSLALPFAQRQKAHIDLDLVLNRIPAKMREALMLAVYFISLIFSIIFTYYGFRMFYTALMVEEKGVYYLGIPLWPIKIALFIGTLLLTIQIVRMLVSHCHLIYQRHKENPKELRNNVLLTLPIFAILIAFSLWLINVDPIIGLIVLMCVLLLGGVPIGFCIGLVGAAVLFFVFGGERSLYAVTITAYSELNSFVLVALPLFIFAGQVMQSGKLAEQFFKVGAAFLGHLPGGLGIATMAACALFAAINGSSAATAATIGLVAIPELVSRGYSKSLACGMVAAGGTLGILIPPSNSMILIGAITGESVGKLFMAGVIPGVMMAVLFAITVAILARRGKSYIPMPKVSWKGRAKALKGSIWAIALPVIILGGIYTGAFTVTEAAAVAVVYAVVASLINRTIKARDVSKILGESTTNTGMVFMIVIGALILGFLVTKIRAAQLLVEAVLAANMPNWMFIVAIMAILLLLGTVLEGISITLIIIPILVLPLKTLGMEMIWFAVLFTINMELAQITPPVAININIVQMIGKATTSEVLRGVWVLFVVMLIAMAIVALVPEISLFIPNHM